VGITVDTVTAQKRLEEIRDGLERSIAVLNGTQLKDVWSADFPQDPADAGANLSENERSEAVLALARSQQSEVLAALRRIELGSYGMCVDCGGAVPEGRLEAKPEAARCVACQGKWDRQRR
jgi:DnaK suppressor protein